MAIKVANNQSLTAITALPSAVSGGAMTLLETQTASGSATLSFTSNIDDTYDEYVFKFYDIHPATDNTQFAFQVDTGTNTSYNIACTSSTFRAYADEADSDAGLGYVTGEDQAQGTAFQKLTAGGTVGNDNDQSASGYLHIFNPSSSVFVKHFICRSNASHNGDYTADFYAAGYFNTTTALTRVQFKMNSGNIDAGVIKLYGIS